MDDRTYAFVAGLHRSGTTLVADILGDHPEASGLSGTGVPEDEGQHLQDMVTAAKDHGGAGSFAFDGEAHLTEEDPRAGREAGERMAKAWEPYWDLGKPVLVEKSPPNLLRTRFLQACFPDARFVVVVRHPVPVALSTHKWSVLNTLERQVRHWVAAHETFREDEPELDRVHVLKYEDLVADPDEAAAGVHEFLGLDPEPVEREVRDANEGYLETWRELREGLLKGPYVRWIETQSEADVEPFGYSLRDLDRVDPWAGA